MDRRQLDIGKCFADAWSVYKVNILMVLLATIIFQLISLFTVLILSGPIFGGYCLMMINAMRKQDKKVELNDMFKLCGSKFGPLLGLFFLQVVAMFAGFLLLVVPGVLLMTMWMYSYFMMVDRDKGILDSMKGSWHMVKDNGFWINLSLAIIYIILTGASNQIPVVGWAINIIMVPFAVLLITSGYMQQSVDKAVPVDESRPFANIPEQEGQA
jgi:hypothetical protein